MPTISLRISDDEIETLDRLVIAVRAYYERETEGPNGGRRDPRLAQMFAERARETTRSSALRDLLLAWKHGSCDQFTRHTTETP